MVLRSSPGLTFILLRRVRNGLRRGRAMESMAGSRRHQAASEGQNGVGGPTIRLLLRRAGHAHHHDRYVATDQRCEIENNAAHSLAPSCR